MTTKMRVLGGSSQDLDTWLGSPPFISHKFRPFVKGPTTPVRWGQKRSPWLFTTYKSWDDPPSRSCRDPGWVLPVGCGFCRSPMRVVLLIARSCSKVAMYQC